MPKHHTASHTSPLLLMFTVLAASGCVASLAEEHPDAHDHELPDVARDPDQPLPSAEMMSALGVSERGLAGGCPEIKVVNTNGGTLTVRTGASTSHSIVGWLDANEQVRVLQSATGQDVGGTNRWYEVKVPGVLQGWVSAAFASCQCSRVKVVNTGGATLRARQSASTAAATVGFLDAGEHVTVVRIVDGEAVDGNKRWYEVDAGVFRGYVSGAYASCVNGGPPGYLLPVACGRTVVVSQGNNSNFSHQGAYGKYSFDFSLSRGNSLKAMKDGVVVAVFGGTRPGSACWAGGGPDCINAANYVVLHHDDNTQTAYVHLDEPTVSYGATVRRGEEVGLSGGTGYSTGPHAHVQRQTACTESVFCPNVALSFGDAGVPGTGASVTSQNCP